MSSAPHTDKSCWSVSELNQMARNTLEKNYSGIQVEGEISELLQHRSGHWYFTLKDDNAQLRCAMFRYQNRTVRFQPENGQQVLLSGKLSLYEARGSYQFITDTMQPAGVGKLHLEFEQLKIRLGDEGLFQQVHKQPLPSYPSQIAIVTSPQGAAIRDIQSTFARRCPSIELIVSPVEVQGKTAATKIAAAITRLNRLARDQVQGISPQAIIITRGGGSLEDLWPFNEEVLARAVYDSELPIVSAVGHETDITIADLVADVRAATPTAAAEILSPDRDALVAQLRRLHQQLVQRSFDQVGQKRLQLQAISASLKHPGHRVRESAQMLDHLDTRLRHAMESEMAHYNWRLEKTTTQLKLASPAATVEARKQQLVTVYKQLVDGSQRLLASQRQRLESCTSTLQAVSPLATIARGYSVTTDQEGKPIVDAKQVTQGQTIVTRLASGRLASTVSKLESDG